MEDHIKKSLITISQHVKDNKEFFLNNKKQVKKSLVELIEKSLVHYLKNMSIGDDIKGNKEFVIEKILSFPCKTGDYQNFNHSPYGEEFMRACLSEVIEENPVLKKCVASHHIAVLWSVKNGSPYDNSEMPGWILGSLKANLFGHYVCKINSRLILNAELIPALDNLGSILKEQKELTEVLKPTSSSKTRTL